MTASIGLSNDISYLIIKSAGVGEVILGLLLFIFYKPKALVLLNIIGLIVLLLFVALLHPQLLIAAFNPVTTNIPLIGLSLILLNSLEKPEKN